MKIIQVDVQPNCEVCRLHGDHHHHPAVWDTPVMGAGWAFACDKAYKEYSSFPEVAARVVMVKVNQTPSELVLELAAETGMAVEEVEKAVKAFRRLNP